MSLSGAAGGAARGKARRPVSGKGGGGGGAVVGVDSASSGMLSSLVTLNDRVERAHCNADLLYRLITDKSGIDLRALVTRIKVHVCGMAKELHVEQQRVAIINEQQSRFAPAFTQKKITEDDMQSLEHLFDKLCGLSESANDDKARIAQLACVFSILTTDIDIRGALTDSASSGGSDQDADRKAANRIDKRALTLFLQHDARGLMTAYRDGGMTAFDYVDSCIAAYMSYLPTLTPLVARHFFEPV